MYGLYGIFSKIVRISSVNVRIFSVLATLQISPSRQGLMALKYLNSNRGWKYFGSIINYTVNIIYLQQYYFL